MLSCCCLTAQQNSMTVMTAERTIQKLPAPGTDAEMDKARCGDYLLYWANPQGLTLSGPRLGYVTERMAGDPPDASIAFTFLKSKFVVITDASKAQPTAKAEVKDGTVASITIRISPADRKKAACLMK